MLEISINTENSNLERNNANYMLTKLWLGQVRACLGATLDMPGVISDRPLTFGLSLTLSVEN